MSKTRGIFIKRRDLTVEPDKDGKYPVKWFPCKVNAGVPPSHKMLREF